MANLTKKDFDRIAHAVRDLRAVTRAHLADPFLQREERAARIEQAFNAATRELGGILSEHNPKFNLSTFQVESGAPVTLIGAVNSVRKFKG